MIWLQVTVFVEEDLLDRPFLDVKIVKYRVK
jgi:hypothetical protein